MADAEHGPMTTPLTPGGRLGKVWVCKAQNII